ncbi:MAG: putative toxin-antitoxin system toxin component, PIN family [Oscillospiraceae bacterium]|jgi:putative PIN family toxin of toxin-antitoxin system|nr:putative toxin-antitoxin system toxin component, PIN family [Oscillospiraceae bacterium]
MNIVLDTNVLVFALMKLSGITARAAEMAASGDHTIYLSEAIIDEYARVLRRAKFSFKESDINDLLSLVADNGIVISGFHTDEPFIDESDRKFYEVAVTSRAYLITGNKRHFPSDPRVISPREFSNMARLP